MSRITRTFTDTVSGRTSNAYSDDGGKTWRWVSNDTFIMLDVCRDYAIPCDSAMQKVAREQEVDAFLSEYRRINAGRARSDEEISEQRAAFGEGVELMDVFTGDRWTT